MSHTSHTPQSVVRLGANHGYLIDGDVAQLHADIEVQHSPTPLGDLALQLWACEHPHTGGAISGVKVAEAGLTHHAEAAGPSHRLDVAAQARVPGGHRDYAMVLVLASGEPGRYTQVHDFANYSARQRFITPHLDGHVGYAIDGDAVTVHVETVANPRSDDNLSGSLRLELWALPGRYDGGTFEGHALAHVDLGRIAGQREVSGIAARVPFSPPPAGHWELTLMLREWAGPAGYVTRDYAPFAVPYIATGETPAPRVDAATAASSLEGDVRPIAGGQVSAHEPPDAPATLTDTPAAVADTEPAQHAAPIVPVDAAAPAAPRRVSANHASAEQLAAVKGLTRAVAAEIVKGRPYASLDALIEVRGIGPKLLAKVRPQLSL